jgi:FkbM family methyltransferase
MIPATAAILRAHAAENGADNVVVIESALSDVDGAKVRALVAQGTFGQASIVSVRPHLGTPAEIELETITLDTALADIPAVRLIKMDLEGAEFLALSGARKVLSKTQFVVFESNQRDERIFDLLVNAGFEIKVLAGNDFLASRNSGQAGWI